MFFLFEVTERSGARHEIGFDVGLQVRTSASTIRTRAPRGASLFLATANIPAEKVDADETSHSGREVLDDGARSATQIDRDGRSRAGGNMRRHALEDGVGGSERVASNRGARWS
jgi:hypothetical protein